MLRVAAWIREKYQVIIVVTVLLGLALGLWTTAPGKAILPYSQALTFLMIFFISLTITPRQFALVVRQPGAVAAGLALNFIFMPLLCWALARLLVGLPVALAFIVQMLTASTFYRFLIRQTTPDLPAAPAGAARP